MLSTKPLAVLIPTCNRSAALLECLAHLERQTWKDFEVLVVDDGSTDSTPIEIEAYCARTVLNIRHVRQKNAGPAKARNLGISLLRSPICLMLGDDIFASPGLVEQHLRFHREHAAINAAAIGKTQWELSGQTITPLMRWLENDVQFAYNKLLAGESADWKHFYTSNLSVKTELLRQFPFREDFPYAAMEDNELAYRIETRCGLDLTFLPQALADHLHPTTFRQSCERMVRVGYSTRLFHELWPERRIGSVSWLRKTLALGFIRYSFVLKLLTAWTDWVTRHFCPNPFVKLAHACYYEIGYKSDRDREGKLVLR